MPTPPKPAKVIQMEKKSHRTKKEIKIREKGEKALTSGTALKERSEVKNNIIAHQEFERINELLTNIEKNDAIYEVIINRYCLMIAECVDMENKRERCYQIIENLDEVFDEEIENAPEDERAKIIRAYSKSYNESMKSLIAYDSQIQSKRKMLLDIEKENIMTIAAALRSIPKKDDGKNNELANILKNG